jgi:uncharacterized protein (DUF1800 family)
MKRIGRPKLPILFFAFLLFIPGFAALAQLDPDPNSPQPYLLTQADGHVVANHGPAVRDPRIPGKWRTAFEPDSTVVIYATNFAFMPGEGANSLRVYGIDPKGRQYRFPVLEITPIKRAEGIFGVVVRLKDEIGYWPVPETGDLQMYLTWRGISSNKALFGFGGNGGWKRSPEPLSPVKVNKAAKATATVSPEYVGYRWSSDRMRFLQQATFGATPTLDERIRRTGIRTWLATQFEEPYPSALNPYPDIPLKNTDSANVTNGCGMFASGTPELRACLRDHYSMYPLQTWFFREAFYGEPQLRHRAAWALSQIWVVSGVDTQQSSWMIAYHQKLSQHAFGNYRQLMKDVTLNPAMGNYLDMVRSTAGNPNENYPREILQLFTTGLFMLNQDGTLQTDAMGDPIPTFDQDKINNFTKVFTGWNFCQAAPPTCPNAIPGLVNYKDPMLLANNGSGHDLTAKTLFNYPGAPFPTIPACPGCTGTTRANYANASLDQVLDNIFNHPNVGPFVSKLLIQHLVTSDPTPAYVGRVAAIFNNNGLGVRGDMKAVIRAILLDPEARGDVKTDPNYGKLREPVQLITNVLKAANVKSFDLTQNSDGAVDPLWANLAQNPFNAPTVFNYYSADNIIPGTTLLGPEFGIMTTGTSIARANFVNTMVFTGLTNVGQETRPLGTKLDLAEFQAAAAADATGDQLLDLLNQRMMNNRMSAEMRSRILTAVQAIASNNPALRAQHAIYLVATSSQFQVQR